MKNLRFLCLSILTFAFVQNASADQILLTCKAKNPRGAYQELSLIKKVDGLHVDFKNIFAGGALISQKVQKLISTPTGLKYLFDVQAEGNIYLIRDGQNVAVFIEANDTSVAPGSMIEFLDCK